MIYLDNAATTIIDKYVAREMISVYTSSFGNPGAKYALGKSARDAVEVAREQVASFLDTESQNIVFTSGGSESNNLALFGISDWLKQTGKTHIVISAIEHHSTLAALHGLADFQTGFTYTIVDPDENGVVQPDSIAEAIRDDTGLVIVMYVNNETGVINDVKSIGELCRNGILFMVDCVQAAGTLPIHVHDIGCCFASISSHKIHGPKGVGALYCRFPYFMKPIIYGGKDQEHGLRGGTENVAGIVGFGKACAIASANMDENREYIRGLKREFCDSLKKSLELSGIEECMTINGALADTSEKVLSITFKDVDAETLIMLLNMSEIYVSAGSACNSTEHEPSHVLKAMGLSDKDARSTIRVSFSKMNTLDGVKSAAAIIARCVSYLKENNTWENQQTQ